MSNSSLTTYTCLSPNRTCPRTHAIDTITIHCVVGQCTVESLGAVFASASRQASSNYGVDKDGRVGLYVNECDRSWCSSSVSNDHRAVTIEVASDTVDPYKVTDKALSSLIALVTDICKRNGIKKLLWQGNKSLVGQVDKQNMTVHRWFANKACPGDYLYNLHPYIAEQVNINLEEDEEVKTTTITAKMNGVLTELTSIIYNDENYIRIRDLADAQKDDNLTVAWDATKKEVVITSK